MGERYRETMRRAWRRQPAASSAAAIVATGTACPSPHRFADVGVAAGERCIVERALVPIRFGGYRATGTPLAWWCEPPFDLVEERCAYGEARVTAVRVVDLALEPYRSAAGIERKLTPLVDRLGAMLRPTPAKHTLHLELSGEPTKDQIEGLARVRDHALKRVRETSVELAVQVAAPAGRPELRPPKP